MNKVEAEKRIGRLRELINNYRYHYHVLDESIMSEAAADSLKHELSQLEAEYLLPGPDGGAVYIANFTVLPFQRIRIHEDLNLPCRGIYTVGLQRITFYDMFVPSIFAIKRYLSQGIPVIFSSSSLNRFIVAKNLVELSPISSEKRCSICAMSLLPVKTASSQN